MTTVFVPDALFSEGRLQRGAALVVRDGKVLSGPPAPDATVVRLPGRVLLPGLVNGHSHAFQRLLRGRTEFLAPGHERDDFWSWREAMYAAATALSAEDVAVASRQAFLEMALAGITTVGEFHYLHHQPDGAPYADPNELAHRVVQAARDVGLRIVLLRVVYARAGFQVEPNPRQQRFLDPDVDTALRRAGDLRSGARDPLVTVGLAPHSVRAVPRPWLERIAAQWRGGPVHAHVAEQPAELAACLAEHGRRPVELLDEVGLLTERFTGVHGIHLEPGEVAALGRARALVCACPSTERNLGDGIVRADELAAAGVDVCLGSDSQAHIDLLDEARQLEGHLRLLRQRRNVLAPAGGGLASLAERLFWQATGAGARSLGLGAATLGPGAPADFFTVDLSHPALAGAPESLLSSVVFAAPPASVRDVAVAGKLIVRDGVHPLAGAVAGDFARLCARVAGA